MGKKYHIKKPCDDHQLHTQQEKDEYYCSTCSKCVKDLSAVDTENLSGLIKSFVGSCVRISPRQLKYLNSISTLPKRSIVTASAVAVLMGSCKTHMIADYGPLYGSIAQIKNAAEKESVFENQIRGLVVDSYTKEPLIGVTIMIKDSDINTISDLDGAFNTTLPSMIDDQATIVFQYIGYHSLEIELAKIIGKKVLVDLGPGPEIGYLELSD